MSQLLEKHLLLLAGLLLMLTLQDNTATVAAFLVGIVMTEFSFLIKNRRLEIGLFLVYFIACFIYWPLVAMVPIAIYELVSKKQYKLLVCGAIVFVMYNKGSMVLLWAMLFLMVLAGALAYENEARHQAQKERLMAIDNAADMERRLKAKNKELLESQEASVYVATLEERNRIAREIHDNVGHMLSRTILQMGALQAIHPEEPLHSQFVSISESLNEAMNNIRESVHDLHDESVDLELSIRQATKELEQNYLIQIDYDMSDSVDRMVKYCFIAVVKEAMANVVKHSNGNKINILLREHPGLYQLYIEDNGQVKKRVDYEGIGLSNMRERVEALGGNLHIETNKGFKIMISIPKK